MQREAARAGGGKAAWLRDKAHGLAPLLGLLATLAFPPFDLKPLAPLALAALLWLMREATAKRALLLGWLFGLAHFASGIYWIYISTHIYGGAPAWLAVFLCTLLFSYMALYPALAFALAAHLGLMRSNLLYLGMPALWLLTELLRGWVGTGFPWLTLGYAGLDTPLQNLAPLFGVHGLSVLIMLIAVALSRLGRRPYLPLAMTAAPLALCLLLPSPGRWTADEGAPLSAALIQGNIAQDQKWLPEMQLPTLLRYRDMTLAALDAELVVWPEVALSQRYHEVRDNLLALLDNRAEQSGSTLLAGVLVYEEAERGHYNSIIGLGAGSGRYNKHHLVPFGEFFPIPDWLRPIMDVLGTPYSDFLFGAKEQARLEAKGVKLAANICFEDVFPSELARLARGTGIVVNLTNDAWFGRSGAPEQHLQIARMRSLETGRPTLRVSNTGRSALIGADGRIEAAAGFFTTETLRVQVQPRSGETPYMRWTDIPLWLFALAVTGLLVVLSRRNRG